MKKRIISALLTVLMVMSLFTGLSVSAYADDENPQVVEYTLKSGDYVLKLCGIQGINYFTCKDAIIKLNGLRSEDDFRFLAVGRVIKLPATDAAALAIISSGSTGTGSTGSSGATAGTVSAAKGSDSVAYYLIPYTIQRGETVAGVCNSLGISFSNYADQIMKLNNISSWNKGAAGKTLLLPSPKAPAVGTTCYQVIAHKIASGETAYNMAASYGIDYGQNTKLLQALNNTSNLAKVKAGSTFYIPVATTITATDSGNNGGSNNGSNSGNNNNNNSGNNNSGNNNSGNNSSSQKYSITPNINTAYGTMTFYVNNATVSSAAAGDTVTVDVNTTDGKAISRLVVKHADGSADVKLEGNTFIMPGCNVRVDAEIQSGYNIEIESNYPTITAATVGGVSASSASQGANVKIVSTDPGYMVESATVYYTNWLGAKTFVTVNDAMCFIMPADDVVVKATLKAVPTYNFYRKDCTNGSFDLQVNGFSASKAAKDAQVTIVWKAMDGYTLTSISVKKVKADGTLGDSVNVLNNSFTMPGCDVNVELSFGQTNNAIVINAAPGGKLTAHEYTETTKDGATTRTVSDKITEALTGKTIFVKGEKDTGFTDNFNITVTRNADGNLVAVESKSFTIGSVSYNGYTFTMPAGGVTIDGQFIGGIKKADLEFDAGIDSGDGNGNIVFFNGEETDKKLTGKEITVGSKITLGTLAREGYAFNKFEVYVDTSTTSNPNFEYSVELSELANTQGYFLMPNSNVRIKTIFQADAIALEAATIRGSGDVSYQVSTDGKDGTYQTANSCKVGDWVKVVVKPSSEGYVVPENAILVTDKATNKVIKLVKPTGSNHFAFQMPSKGVTVYVILVGDLHKLELRTINADNNTSDLQGKSLWQVEVEGNWPVVENKTLGSDTEVKAHDPVVLSLTEPGAANYVVDKVVLKTATNGSEYAGGIEFKDGRYYFAMPDDDTTCTVYLKSKSSNDVSLVGCLSYDSSRGSANFEKAGTTGTKGTVISSCKVGDTIMVRATAAEGYTLTEDDIVITRADGGTLTKGTDVADGNFKPEKDGGKVIGWTFKMPQGGVRVTVNFKPTEAHGISLEIKDQDGNLLKGQGYVAVQYGGNSFTDISTDLGKVPYGSAVTVSLTDVGKSLYSLTKVTVDGVSCENKGSFYGFYMPNKDADIKVTLTAKTADTNSYKLFSSYDYSKGTVGFYDKNGNPIDTAAEGDAVDIVFTPADGYMLDSYSIVRNTDNVTVDEQSGETARKTTKVTVTMGDKPGSSSTGLYAKDGITVAANFVNKVYTAEISIKGLPTTTGTATAGSETTGTGESTGATTGETSTGVTTGETGTSTSTTSDQTANLLQFKGADGKYKAVQNGSKVEVVFNSNVNIGLTTSGSSYKITGYVVYSASDPTKKLADIKGDCNDFNFWVTKDGVSKIEITLAAK